MTVADRGAVVRAQLVAECLYLREDAGVLIDRLEDIVRRVKNALARDDLHVARELSWVGGTEDAARDAIKVRLNAKRIADLFDQLGFLTKDQTP